MESQAPQGRPSPMPPSSDDLGLIAALHADLAEAEFTNNGVAALLGTDAVAGLDREQVVPGQLRVLEVLGSSLLPRSGAGAAGVARPQWRCAVLTALWLVAVPVTAEQVEVALPRTGVEGLRRLGLAVGPAPATCAAAVRGAPSHRNGAYETAIPEDSRPPGSGERTVRPLCDLRPYQVEGRSSSSDMWITSDLGAHQVQDALPHDHVLGVGQASLTLAGITHRRPVQTALDIGTGCGIQLLHLLDHAEYVVGTDLSQRALDFTRFNLLLNAPALGLDPDRLEERVELLQGSLLAPLAGRGFDLVVSNPPFVITPRRSGETEAERYVYRDGGREGDALIQELITGMPEVLNPGGTVQMLGNWEIQSPPSGHLLPENSPHQLEPSSQVTSQPDWAARPRSWAQDAGLSAWFIQRDVQTPAEYAETWLRDASEDRSVPDYRRRYAEYLADFASRSVEQIGFGLIWLQRTAHDAAGPAPDRWQRLEQLTGEVQQPLGPVIGETAHRAQQVARDPAAVLGQRLTVPETVTEERYQRFGAEHPEVIVARQGAGLRRSRAISSSAAGFMAAADGEFTAGQLITAVCSLTEAEEAILTQEVLEIYRDGFLSA